LLTLAKDKPFVFLDHSIRCGDSLVGLHSIDQLRHYSLKPDADDAVLFKGPLDSAVDEAINLRLKLEGMTANTVEDVQRQEKLLIEANEKIARLRCAADLLVAAEFWGESAKDKLERVRHAAVKSGHYVEKGPTQEFEQVAAKERRVQTMFHWPLEFPEVIVKRGGFDAFVGNPPYSGGKKIAQVQGDSFVSWTKSIVLPVKGSGDLCTFFLARSHALMHRSAFAGFLLTDSIREGDSQKCGPEYLVQEGDILYRAHPEMKWPGDAQLFVCPLHFTTAKWRGAVSLRDSLVETITPFLTALEPLGDPFELADSKGKAAKGVTLLGEGFILTNEERDAFVNADSLNDRIIKPFLVGGDITSQLSQIPSRFVIDFGNMSLDEANRFNGPMSRLHERVRPQREKLHRQIHETCFWKHWDRREKFFQSLKGERVLVSPQVSQYWIVVFVPAGYVYDQQVVVFQPSSNAAFAVIQSSFHEAWARREGVLSIGKTPRYTASTAFNTFPFPVPLATVASLPKLDSIGKCLHEHRAEVLKRHALTFNSFEKRLHNQNDTDEGIRAIRDLHVEMDQAVAAAYGWTDLELGHGFHETKQGVRFTISESARREVLQRLLKLNHERYAEEVKQGLHSKKKGAAKKVAPKKKPAKQEASLFDGEDDV
jgi:hypothetical protein